MLTPNWNSSSKEEGETGVKQVTNNNYNKKKILWSEKNQTQRLLRQDFHVKEITTYFYKNAKESSKNL